MNEKCKVFLSEIKKKNYNGVSYNDSLQTGLPE
jgi:hypothetical protein